MMQQCISHSAPTLTVLVKKYTPCQGVVWSQYRLSGTFYVPLIFGVVLFAKVCFFLPMQFNCFIYNVRCDVQTVT